MMQRPCAAFCIAWLLCSLCGLAWSPLVFAACIGEGREQFLELEDLAFRKPAEAIAKLQSPGFFERLGSQHERAQWHAIIADAYREQSRFELAYRAAQAGLQQLGSDTASDLAKRLQILEASIGDDMRSGIAALTQQLAQSGSRELLRACILRELGWLSHKIGDELSGVRDLLQAKTSLRIHGTKKEQMVTTVLLAGVLHESGDVDLAQKLLDEAIAYFRSIDAPLHLSTALTRRAIALILTRQFEQAELAAQESLRISTELGDQANEAFSYVALCEAVGMQQRSTQALEYCDLAENRMRKQGIYDSEAKLNLSILRVEFSSAQPDKWLAMLNEGIAASAEIRPRLLARAYAARATLYAKRGDFQAAYSDQNHQLAYSDSLQSADRTRTVSLLRVQFETEQSAFEKAEQTQQREQAERRVLSASMIAVYALVALAALIYLVGLNHRYQRRLLALAEADAVTGLANRRKMLDVAQAALQNASEKNPVVLGLVDIDHFKSINDQQGQDVGDLVLLRFSEVAKQTLGDAASVGRYSGDEFLLVLQSSDQQSAREQAERLRQAVAAAVLDAPLNPQLRFTVSIGLVIQTSAELRTDEVLRRCDSALYEAKRRGRNVVCVYDPKNSS